MATMSLIWEMLQFVEGSATTSIMPITNLYQNSQDLRIDKCYINC